MALVANPEMNLGIESNTGHQAGVRAFDLRKLQESSVDLFRIKSAHKFDPEKVISYLVDHLGAPYDWGGVISLGFMKAGSLLTGGLLKMHNSFQKEKDYFCSELAWEAFDKSGLDIVPQIGQSETTSPGDIARSSVVEQIV